MRIQTVAIMSFWALCAICGGAETLRQDWSHDINGMSESFEESLRDVARRRWSDRLVERDFFEHIINLPVSTNTTYFDLRMAEKRRMLKKTQDRLEYCQTNETAFLLLAVHLGLLMEIPTNTWYAEGMRARMEDDKEAEKRVAPKGLSLRRRYTGCGYSGPHINAWELRWEKYARGTGWCVNIVEVCLKMYERTYATVNCTWTGETPRICVVSLRGLRV